MKISNLRNYLISFGAAIIVGVLLVGANAAFGEPTHEPPGDGIGPKFTEIYVGDNGIKSIDGRTVAIRDDVYIDGGVSMTGALDLSGEDTSISAHRGDFSTLDTHIIDFSGLGLLRNTKSGDGADGEYHDNLPVYVEDYLMVRDAISDLDGTVVIDGDLEVTGTADISLDPSMYVEYIKTKFTGNHYSGPFSCPSGKKLLSCNPKFTAGVNLVSGILNQNMTENSCDLEFTQTANGTVSVTMQLLCL